VRSCIFTMAALLALVPAVPDPAVSQEALATVEGTVRAAETGRGIAHANVVLVGTLAGAATDRAGNFKIPRVVPGRYNLSASVIGYRTAVVDIVVAPGQALHLDITLTTTPIEIAPIVVTAARRAEDALDVPVGFAVITSRDIEKVDATSPDEILRYAPGVVVTDNQVDVRGSGGFNRGAGSRMLLLVDGVPALAGDTGDIKWDLIPPDDIQRIEILKSAASSLYGSTALGGVINIVTLPVSDEPVTAFHLSGGFYGDPYYPEWKWAPDRLTFAGIDVSHSRRVGDLGLFLAAGRKQSDGYRRNSDFDRSNITAKLTYPVRGVKMTLFNAWAHEKHGHATEWASQADALDIDPAAYDDRVRSDKAAGYLRASSLVGMRSAFSATVNWYHTDWQNDFHDTDDNARALRLGGTVQWDRIASPRFETTLGCEAWNTHVRSTMFGTRDVTDLALFAETKTAVYRRTVLRVGGRCDGHTDEVERAWQVFLSPRVAVAIEIGNTSALSASIGRGFRAPSIAEMFTSTTVGGFTVKPNLELAPETGTTYELGWTASMEDYLHGGLSVFRSDYEDLIEPEVDPSDGKLHFVNVSGARVSGFEIWTRTAPIGGTAIAGVSYMYLSTEDRADHIPLAYRSRHNLKTSLDVSAKGFTLGLDSQYRSRVERVKVYEDDERVSIYVTDLRGEVTMGRFRLSAKVANLFNYNYTEIERNLAPIRSFRFSLTGRL
jgi:outer membrane receptor for ferrienterochelin and colicins